MNRTFLLCLLYLFMHSASAQLVNEGLVYTDELSDPLFSFSIDSTRCKESEDGKIQISNLNEYIDSVFWDNGSKELTRENLSEGIYSLLIYLNYGSSYLYDFKIDSPTKLTVIVNQNMLKNNIELSAEVSGGSAPYVYFWSTGESTSQILCDGQLSREVFVEDSHGCGMNASVLFENEHSDYFSLENEVMVDSEGMGSLQVFTENLQLQVVCYSKDGKKVVPFMSEKNRIKFQGLSQGYYFLVGNIGAKEFRTKVFVL